VNRKTFLRLAGRQAGEDPSLHAIPKNLNLRALPVIDESFAPLATVISNAIRFRCHVVRPMCLL
jgi:hypothetical protein